MHSQQQNASWITSKKCVTHLAGRYSQQGGGNATIPHLNGRLESSGTSHKPARIKCSLHWLQTWERPVQKKKKKTPQTHFRKRFSHLTRGGAKTKIKISTWIISEVIIQCWGYDTDSVCASHREVGNSDGVLQQLLKGDGPTQHAVSLAGLSALTPWQAAAAASTAPRRHVQLWKAYTHTNV